jgi:hypothetical protein
VSQVTKSYSNYLAYQVTTSLRGILTTAIYDKTLRLSCEQLSEGNIVTLVSTDLVGLERTVPLFYAAVIALIEIALGLVILANILGPACVLAVIPTICKLPTNNLPYKKFVIPKNKLKTNKL